MTLLFLVGNAFDFRFFDRFGFKEGRSSMDGGLRCGGPEEIKRFCLFFGVIIGDEIEESDSDRLCFRLGDVGNALLFGLMRRCFLRNV